MYKPGTKTVYSDVDYMLLAFAIEAITGKGLDAFLKETFWDPMGLTHTTYNPAERLCRQRLRRYRAERQHP